MDTITARCILIFCATAVFIIISWSIVSCCCCGVTYVYSQRFSTIDEETPAIRMSEFRRYSKRNLSTIDEETRNGTEKILEKEYSKE